MVCAAGDECALVEADIHEHVMLVMVVIDGREDFLGIFAQLLQIGPAIVVVEEVDLGSVLVVVRVRNSR